MGARTKLIRRFSPAVLWQPCRPIHQSWPVFFVALAVLVAGPCYLGEDPAPEDAAKR